VTYVGRIEALRVVPTGGAAASATNSVGGPSTCTVAAGSYYLTAAGGVSGIVAALQTALNTSRPSGWTVTMSTNGVVTIDCSNRPFSLSWTSTALRDQFGFAGNITSSSVAVAGTKQAKGVWYPDCPLRIGGHPKTAPKVSDLLTLVTPGGDRTGLVSNVMRRHRALVWAAVPVERYREASAALVNASWEMFLDDTQLGQGHSWFTPTSKLQIYFLDGSTDTLIGADAASGAGVSGWYADLPGSEAALTADPWTGLYRIEIPEITTSG